MALCPTKCSSYDWRSITIKNKCFLIRSVENEQGWKIFVTDLREIWTGSVDRSEIQEKCKKWNSNLCVEDVDVADLVGRSLLNVVTITGSVGRIEFAEKLEDGVFKFCVDLVAQDFKIFWEEVTLPLCSAARELRTRLTALTDLVKRKDEEIAEYKMNGARLTRPHIETAPFNPEIFEKSVLERDIGDVSLLFKDIVKSCERVTPEFETNAKTNKHGSMNIKEQQSKAKILKESAGGIVRARIGGKVKNVNGERNTAKFLLRRSVSDALSISAKRLDPSIHDFIA